MRNFFEKGKWLLLGLVFLVLPMCLVGVYSFSGENAWKNDSSLAMSTLGKGLDTGDRLATASPRSATASTNLNDLSTYSLNNTRQSVANVSLSEVHWNPSEGVDTNDGTNPSLAVKTLDKAKMLVSPNGKIYMSGQYTLEKDTTIDFGGLSISLLGGVTGDAYFNVNGAYNLTFKNATITTQDTITLPLIKCANSSTLNISDITFSNLKANNIIQGEAKSNITIEDSSIENCNMTHFITGKYASLSLKNCTFTSNTSSSVGGALYLEGETTLSDCTFTKNTSTGGGGAIYVASGSLYVKDKLTVQGNKSIVAEDALVGGGIYVAENATLVIERDVLFVCTENTHKVSSGDTETNDNLLLMTTNKKILKGDLQTGSTFGLGCRATDSAEQNALLSFGLNYPLLETLKGCATSDNDDYGLKFVSIKGGDCGLVFYKKEQTNYWSIVDDRAVKYDATKSYTVNDITIMYGDEEVDKVSCTTKYSTDGTTFSSQKPTFTGVGQYEVKYQTTVTTSDGHDTTISGSTYLSIIGVRLYVESYPKAYLTYKGYLRDASFVGGRVVNDEGKIVTGTWSFVDENTEGNNNVIYSAKFTPSNTATLNVGSDYFLTELQLAIRYSIVFYKDGYFCTDLNTYSRIGNITQLEDIIALMEDDGTLVFCSTYKVNGVETIDVKDKTLTFARHKDFVSSPMISVEANTNELKNSLTLSGDIVFDGASPYGGNISDSGNVKNDAIFEVGNPSVDTATGGTLNINSGVVIKNWTLEFSAQKGLIIICSPGTVNLDGCKISSNKITSSGDYKSSVILNSGTLNLVSGEFYENENYYLPSTISGETTTSTAYYGGFLSCVGGKATMTGGTIGKNTANYGGAIYLEDATLKLLGGKIYANKGITAGGAIYATGSSSITIDEDFAITDNMSGSLGTLVLNNVEKTDSITIVNSDGTAVTGISAMSKLDEIERKNLNNVEFKNISPKNNDENTTQERSVGVVLPIACATCVVLICLAIYEFIRKNKTKFTKK